MDKKCPKCQALLTNDEQCDSCQLVLSKYRPPSKFRFYIRKDLPKIENNPLPYFEDSKKLRLFALPSVLLFSLFCLKTPLVYLLLYLKVWIHEFGHAGMAWASGLRATPLSFGGSGMAFMSSSERSIYVYLCFIFLNSFLIRNSIRDKAPFIFFGTIPLIIFSTFMFFFATDNKIEEMTVMGGFAGEILISFFMVISFYFRFPGKADWNYFLRWPILLIGLFTLLNSTSSWIEVHQINSLTPFGINNSESAVLGVPGDLYRLRNDYDWTLSKFKRVYLGLCFFSWLLIGTIYIYFASQRNPKTN